MKLQISLRLLRHGDGGSRPSILSLICLVIGWFVLKEADTWVKLIDPKLN